MASHTSRAGSAVGGGAFARGAVVALDGSLSADADGRIAVFAWSFGDGVEGTGALAEHIYNAAGTFDVTLTVTDDDGVTDTAALRIVIEDNEAPVAIITAPPAGGVGASLRFDGSGSSDADGSVASFTWDLGDGTTGVGPLFDKVYDASGTFTVTLTVTVTDDDGAASMRGRSRMASSPCKTASPSTRDRAAHRWSTSSCAARSMEPAR